ncbi:MAG: fibronectin type III domain-containing protein [Burkholderiales bacterium]|nr:fibronectin type III domain-containing protein [Anaerolineae bacterium]
MKNRTILVLCLFFLICISVFSSVAVLSAQEDEEIAGFEILDVYLEQNVTDGDMELVVVIEGPADGIEQLTVVAPNGDIIVDHDTSGEGSLGLREFMFESPEPDVETVLASYPEGDYTFFGITVEGSVLYGTASLSHEMPMPTTFVSPEEDAENVAGDEVLISWEAVDNVEGYIVEVEQDEVGFNFTAEVSADTTSFKLPGEFLAAGTEYELGIATENEAGNVSFIETTFTTAE